MLDSDPLSDARTMIKARDYQSARILLQTYLRNNPKSAEGWYLLSMADATSAKRLAAAERAAKLAPKNVRVRARLQKLQQSSTPEAAKARSSSSRLRLILFALILIIVLVAGGVLLIPRLNAPKPTPQNAVSASTGTPNISATASVTPSLVPSRTVTAAAPVVQTEEVTQEIAASPTSSPTATSEATETQTPTLTRTSTLVPTIQPATTAPVVQPTQPPATVVITSGVPIGEVQDVANGQMWVVAANRAAESMILELGGIIDSAPPGQEWVLVELLMICNGSENCAPTLDQIQIVGSSGVPYNVPAGFQILPVFGPDAYMNGQVWGYLGYLVPTSEQTLSLLFTQNGRKFAFELQ
jgi:hypothetical protein